MVKNIGKKPGKPKGPVNTLLEKFITKSSLKSIKAKKQIKHPDKNHLNIFLYRGLRKIMKSRINKSTVQIKKLIIDLNSKIYSELESEIDLLFSDNQTFSLKTIYESIQVPKPDNKRIKDKDKVEDSTEDFKEDERIQDKAFIDSMGNIQEVTHNENDQGEKSHNGKCMQLFYGYLNVQKLFKIVIRYYRKELDKYRFISNFNFTCCEYDQHDINCEALWDELLVFLEKDYFPSLNIKTLSFRSSEPEEPPKEESDATYNELEPIDLIKF